jgi:CubicO group peptidase (beta-lactamase class C family)
MDQKEAIKTALAYAPTWLEFQQGYMPFVGAQVAVRVDGELIFNHAVGMADVANNVALTPDHLFRIASHSKTFTGVAIMQLVEQGKVRLDDTVGDHVADLAEFDMAGVTVRELLAHGSGMIRDGDNCDWWDVARLFPDREELIETVTRHGKVLEANEHFKYSNIGYSVLGLIIESASGISYRDYATEHIVKPLGLENTGPELDDSRIGDYAKGYSSRAHGNRRIEIEHIDTRAESSATGFYGTAADVTAYFQAHLDGDDRIMSDASKRRMRQVQWRVSDESMYGLGLSITKFNGRTYYGHSGGYPGHITMSKLDPERKLSISVFTNTADGPAATLCNGILRLIDRALDEKAKAQVSEPDNLKRFEGRFASLWGYTDVVNLGGRLYSMSPTMDNPAEIANGLEVVSDTELKVVDEGGFGGYGEKMRYTFNEDGSVEKVRGATGHTMIPAEKFTLPEKVFRPS